SHAVTAYNIAAASLLRSLSFTHFVELLEITDLAKRTFYETEAIRGNWTSRELSRQIGALLFERTALSRNKQRAIDQVHETAETDGDNPPIGLLLCTSKDQALVEYASPGMDPQLFVSRYQLERFLTAQVSSLRLAPPEKND